MLLSHFSRVQLCVTPQMAVHQAPPSLGFSRQEHWSGLSFPSPMHESEQWKWSCSVMSDPQRPHGLQPTRLLRPWDFPGKSTGVGCHCLLCGFVTDEYLIVLNALSVSFETITWFLSFHLLMCCLRWVGLRILNHPCILEINPTWWLCMIIFIYC